VGGEAVHVLFRADARDAAVGVQAARQRQLQQNAVHFVFGVESCNNVFQFLLRYRGGQTQGTGVYPHFQRRLFLVAHIDLRGRVISGQDHRKAGSASGAGQKGCDFFLERCAGFGGSGLSVQYQHEGSGIC